MFASDFRFLRGQFIYHGVLDVFRPKSVGTLLVYGLLFDDMSSGINHNRGGLCTGGGGVP